MNREAPSMSQAAPVARAAVILAAGHGTRMKSQLPKVLHTVGGRSMLDRIIEEKWLTAKAV